MLLVVRFSHHKSIHQMNNIMNNLNAITNFMDFCGSLFLCVCESVEKPCQGTNWKSIIIAAGQKWVDLNRSNIGFRVGQSFLFYYSQYKALTRWVGWMNEWVSECVRVNRDDGRFFNYYFNPPTLCHSILFSIQTIIFIQSSKTYTTIFSYSFLLFL